MAKQFDGCSTMLRRKVQFYAAAAKQAIRMTPRQSAPRHELSEQRSLTDFPGCRDHSITTRSGVKPWDVVYR